MTASVVILAAGVSSTALAYPCTVRHSISNEYGQVAVTGTKYECADINGGPFAGKVWVKNLDDGRRFPDDASDIVAWTDGMGPEATATGASGLKQGVGLIVAALALLGLGTAASATNLFATSRRTGRPVGKEYAKETLDNFEVADGDILAAGSQFYRVNRDGKAHNLAGWHLKESGEFYRITGRSGGYVNYKSENYATRVMEAKKNAMMKVGLGLGLALCCAVFWESLDNIRDGFDGFFLPLGAAIFALALAVQIMVRFGVKAKDHSTNPGPQPFKFKAPDSHGPTVGEMPDTGDAVPLDEYRPNV